jgi:PKD repeat protein
MLKNYPRITKGLLATCTFLLSAGAFSQNNYLDSLAETFRARPHMVKSELKKIPKYDRPDLAWEQDFLRTMDPNTGKPENGRLLEVYKRVAALRNNDLARSPGDAQAPWIERGPNNVGGRTRALTWDPATTNKVWAGGVTGGLWYNNDITDANSQWVAVNDFWDNIAVTTIAFDPTDSDIIYVGTGEGWGSSASRGAGIWKSENGGSTWSQLATTTDYYYINKIIVRDESGTGVVYAGCDRKYYEGAYQGNSGLFRSTDGGTSFTEQMGNPSGGTRPYTVADITLGTSDRIWIGTNNNSGNDGGGEIWYSDNGTTWTQSLAIAGSERVAIAAAPSNGNYVYAIFEDGNKVETMRYTANNGASWNIMNEPADVDTGIDDTDFTRGQAWYDLVIAVDPNSPITVIAGGIDLFRSTNSGTTWSQISKWSNNNDLYDLDCSEVHADQHAIVFKDGSSDIALFGNDGGVFYTTSLSTAATNDVIEARNYGYNVTQFYSCAIHPDAGENFFLTGAQDNGSHRFTDAGINATTEVTGGDGAFCHIDQTNPDYQITSYVYNKIYLSTDGGNSFSTILDDQSSGDFINPSDYDNNQHAFYSGYDNTQIKRITNITTSPADDEITVTGKSSETTHLSVSPYTTSSTTIFIGTEDGELFKVTNADGTPSTSQIDGGSFGSGSISSVAFGGSEDTLIVTLFNYGITSVWYSADAGATWNSREGDLPDMPVRWALMNPNNSNEVILATEVGVWSTSDFLNASPSWSPSNSGLANVRVDMLQMRDSDFEVIAATHGRGLFSGNAFAEDGSVPVTAFTASTEITCTGSTVTFEEQSTNAPASWSWTFTGGDPTSSADQHPEVTYNTAGSYTASLTASNVNGAGNTVEKSIFISDGPTSACDVQTQDLISNYGMGIGRVQLHTLDYSSENAKTEGGYQDRTCESVTTLEPSTSYTITVEILSTNNQAVRAYIDYDNNGTFDTGESILNSSSAAGPHTTSFTTPSSVTEGQVLRLRVMSDWSSVSNGCDAPTDGQVEDYGIFFTPTVCDVTVANFSASDSSICVDDDITFTDLSTETPTDWDWSFDGATVSSSTAQNPNITFDTPGLHEISLEATNACGSHTETKALFINVSESYDFEDTVYVCSGESYTYHDGSTEDNILSETSHVSKLVSNSTCDSNITTVVMVNSADADVSINGNELSAVTAGQSYRWLDCDNSYNFLGETNQTYTASSSGNYALEATRNSCVDTSDCENIIITFTENYSEINNGIELTPNPTTRFVNLGFSEELSNVTVEILNTKGHIVSTMNYNSLSDLQIDLSEFTSGVYVLNLRSAERTASFKIVKE